MQMYKDILRRLRFKLHKNTRIQVVLHKAVFGFNIDDNAQLYKSREHRKHDYTNQLRSFRALDHPILGPKLTAPFPMPKTMGVFPIPDKKFPI